MTELQLKIRRLAHRVSALKKGGKDASADAAELTSLRAQRKEELAAEKAAKAKVKVQQWLASCFRYNDSREAKPGRLNCPGTSREGSIPSPVPQPFTPGAVEIPVKAR